jgi:hypothetical protein
MVIKFITYGSIYRKENAISKNYNFWETLGSHSGVVKDWKCIGMRGSVIE